MVKRGVNDVLPLGENKTEEWKTTDKDHHKGVTPFIQIEELDMIKSFPLDYMHLTCLGITKRLLTIWINGINNSDKHQNHVIKKDMKEFLDKLIVLTANYLPKEFNRKGRSLTDLLRWKAVEYRLFLCTLGSPFFVHLITFLQMKNGEWNLIIIATLL